MKSVSSFHGSFFFSFPQPYRMHSNIIKSTSHYLRKWNVIRFPFSTLAHRILNIMRQEL